MDSLNVKPQYCTFPTAIGVCGIGWRGDRIIAAGLPTAQPHQMRSNLSKRTGGAEAKPRATIAKVIAAVIDLLNGTRTDLSFIDCDLEGTDPFAVQVYDLTRAIPVGEVRTYGEIAQQLGDKQLSRQVGQVLGHNPIPIIIPCHRVVGANGKLTGFSATGGTSTKLEMLRIEGAQLGQEAGLFGELPLALKPQ